MSLSNLSRQHFFISYARDNEQIVAQMVRYINSSGLKVWMDTNELMPGTLDWEDSLRNAISNSVAVLLMASPSSRSSCYVKDELQLAAYYNKLIVPIWIEGQSWADSIPLGLGQAQYFDGRHISAPADIEALVQLLNTHCLKIEELSLASPSNMLAYESDGVAVSCIRVRIVGNRISIIRVNEAETEEISERNLDVASLNELLNLHNMFKNNLMDQSQFIDFCHKLFSIVWVDKDHNYYEEFILNRAVLNGEDPVLLYLEIDRGASKLYFELPWELMLYEKGSPLQDDRIAFSNGITPIRYTSVLKKEFGIAIQKNEQLKLLIAAPNPPGLFTISEKFVENVDNLAQIHSHLYQKPQRTIHTTLRQFEETLVLQNPQILILRCDARIENDVCQILFESSTGKMEWVNAIDFLGAFGENVPTLLIVHIFGDSKAILENAISELARLNVAFLVGLRSTINNIYANQFLLDFIGEAACTNRIDLAFQQALCQLAQMDGWKQDELSIPILYTRVSNGIFTKAIKMDSAAPSPPPIRHSTTQIIVERKVRPLKHNLPKQLTPHVIGRKAALNKLQNFIENFEVGNIALIDGIAGIGKTTIALELAYSFVEENEPDEVVSRMFDTIIWISAKTNILLADGIAPREYAATTLDDVVTTISLILDYPSVLKSEGQARLELLKRALSENRTLIILDNYETIEDKRLFAFLVEIPRPTFILITSRRRLPVPNVISISQLTHGEAQQVIEFELNKNKLQLNTNEKDRLVELIDGVPLAITWSIAYINLVGIPAIALRKLVSGKNDLLLFCFEKNLAVIRNKPSYLLLLALTMFPSNANIDDVASVAEVTESEVDDQVIILTRLSFCSFENKRLQMLPLVKRLMLTELTGKDNQLQKFYRRYIDVILAFLVNELENLQNGHLEALTWEAESENVFEAVNIVRQNKWYDSGIKLVIAMYPYMITYGYIENYVRICNWVISVHSSEEKESLLWIYIFLTSIYQHSEQDQKALNSLACASDLYVSMAHVSDELKSHYLFVKVLVGIHSKPESADSYLEEAFRFAHELGVTWIIVGFQGWQGIHLCNQSKWEAGLTVLQEAMEKCEGTSDLRSAVFVAAPLALCLAKLGKQKEAERICNDIGARGEKFAEVHNLAHLYFEHSRILVELGDSTRSMAKARLAAEIYQRLGLSRKLAEVEAFLALRLEHSTP